MLIFLDFVGAVASVLLLFTLPLVVGVVTMIVVQALSGKSEF